MVLPGLALAEGLDGNGLIHHGVEIVLGHGGEHAVDGVLQLGVPLSHRHADVDLALIHFEVVVGAGEVQELHVGIGDHGALGGGHIRADEVHGAGLQSHQHSRGALGGGLDLGVLDLGQHGVIPDSGDLRGAGAARPGR